jgi:siroheme synthase
MFRKSKLSVAVLAAAGTLSAGQVIAQEGMIEEVDHLNKQGVECFIVPGITAAIGCAAIPCVINDG